MAELTSDKPTDDETSGKMRPGSLDILVRKPVKSADSYAIGLEISGPKDSSTETIGFRRANFEVRHADVWDTLLPLMYITRNGGPLFKRRFSHANVRFEFEASRPVVEFYTRRARLMGLSIDVLSPSSEIGLNAQSSGDVLLFGGGKDSRTMLGMVRETGTDPVVVSAKGRVYATDIPDAKVYQPLNFAMPVRIVPSLMMLPKNIYHGAGLGEVHVSHPWHQYTDITAPDVLDDFSAMLAGIGVETKFHVPLVVLPYNVIQRILVTRYPELYKGQISVKKNEKTDKTLHIAMCLMYHGFDASSVADPEVIQALGEDFRKRMLQDESKAFGYRGNYEVIAREIVCLMNRLTSRGKLAFEGLEKYEAPWVDHIHTYTNPGIDQKFLDIFKGYASEIERSDASLPQCLRDCGTALSA